MPSQSRKYRGYESQKFVAQYLSEQGWTYAEPVGAGRPGSDVTGIVGVDIEVKATRGLDLPGLIRQQHERNGDGKLGIGVIRPDGYGWSRIHLWPMVLPFEHGVRLLKEAGF